MYLEVVESVRDTPYQSYDKYHKGGCHRISSLQRSTRHKLYPKLCYLDTFYVVQCVVYHVFSRDYP